MKAICTFCGHANRIETQECVQCGGSLRDARREQVLEPLRPSPAERALLELGKTALSVPPHLRN